MKIVIYSFIFLALLLLVLVFALSWSPLRVGKSQELVVELQESSLLSQKLTSPRDGKLRVMSWNIAWAHGMGSEGVGYTPKDKKYYQRQLDDMAKIIKAQDVDLVLLQEVDFGSAKSHRMDQLRYLAQKAGFPFLAYAPTWKVPYVPYPYWPVRKHFGKLNSGAGILSRFPIASNTVRLFPRPDNYPWWYNRFYPYQFYQYITIMIEQKKFGVINTHLEAWDAEARLWQVRDLAAAVNAHSDIHIVGGDFNSIHHFFPKKDGFKAPFDKEDYSVMALDRLLENIDFSPSFNKSEPVEKLLTFPANGADRRLDYILHHKNIEVLDSYVPPVGAISDHLPVRADFQL